MLCRTPATNLRLRLGDYNLRGATEKYSHEEFGVKRKVINEDYNPATYQNDIALLELSQEVTFKQHIIPVCLPKKGENFTGSMATVTGWGRTTYGVPASLGVLQKVDVEVIDTNTCQQWMKTVGRREVIFSNMLCAGYKEGSSFTHFQLGHNFDDILFLLFQAAKIPAKVIPEVLSHLKMAEDQH